MRLWHATILIALLFVVIFVVGTQAVHVGIEQPQSALFRVENVVTGGTRLYGFVNDTTNGISDSISAPAGFEATMKFETGTAGLTPPALADTITIEMLHDDTSTIVRTVFSGTPIDGEAFIVFLTHDGTATGTPAAGTFRFRIRATLDDGIGANGYDCDSDGLETVDANVDCMDFQAGWFRSDVIVDSFAANAYPAGNQFAAGPTATESVTCTVTRSRVIRTAAYQDERIRIVRSEDQAVVHDGGFGDSTTLGTRSTTDSFGAPDYGPGRNTYGCDFTVTGNSPLSDVAWTIIAIDTVLGPQIIRNSDLQAWDNSVFDGNPNVFWDSDGTGAANGQLASATPSLANRGESFVIAGFLLNAREEQLTRSMTIRIRDAATQSIEHSATDTGPVYGFTYATVAGDQARPNKVGAFKDATAAGPFITEIGTNVSSFALSSRYLIDSHTQLESVLNKDDFPKENMTESFTFISGEDTISFWAHVAGIRQDNTEIDTIATALDFEVINSEGGIVQSGTSDSGADGWTTRVTQAATPPTGEWQVVWNVSFQGNTAEVSQTIDVITSFTGDKVCRHIIWKDFPVDGTYRFWCIVELADVEVEPDFAPILKVKRILDSGASELVLDENMLNVVDDTATVNGAIYYADIDFGEFGGGDYNGATKVFVVGTPVRHATYFEVDLMNETLEAISTFLPILMFVGSVIWAEKTRELWIYVLAALAGIVSVITLPDDNASVRILLVIAIVAIAVRLIQRGTENRL